LAEHSRKSPDDVAAGLLRRERNKSSIKWSDCSSTDIFAKFDPT
jgi:hypothetical protein